MEDIQLEIHELMSQSAINDSSSQEHSNVVNEGLAAVIEDIIQDGLLRLSVDECVASPMTDCNQGLYLTSSLMEQRNTWMASSPPLTRK